MNTKFDIEVLFKTLGVDMTEVRPTSLLKDRVREVEGNLDFSNQDTGGSQPQVITEIRTGIMSTSNQDENKPTLSLLDRVLSGRGLSQVSSSQSPYSVGQDYSMESDKTHVYNAAHLMVASLAGSLAHVTCKEPLRVSISSERRNLLQSFNIPGELQEKAVDIILNGNLDLGCAVIERVATKKLNLGLYSSGLGSLGLSSVAQRVDRIFETVDPSSNQFHSGSSAGILTTEGVIPHDVKVNNIAFLSSASIAI
ncbi:transcription regulator [Actinidia rufa]|uniref:Transcription regulator n=1 Tax=Actinidia rufa TaxID=165716 RepID=A0A7J0ECU2_9ERIC|nr:transcription regulator [Actinidia rufa]